MTTCNFVDLFLNELSVFGADRVFNPWATSCDRADLRESVYIRRRNLRKLLNACASFNEVDLWIGRDLGWRGGRRTGIALVDELTLAEYGDSLGISGLLKATAGPVMKERTATEIQTARARVARKVCYWNVFPFHPHEEGRPQTNRSHTRKERKVGIEFLSQLLQLIPVTRVVAIGNDASYALDSINIDHRRIRHPSYGGQREFHAQIDAFYGIRAKGCAQRTFFDEL